MNVRLCAVVAMLATCSLAQGNPLVLRQRLVASYPLVVTTPRASTPPPRPVPTPAFSALRSATPPVPPAHLRLQTSQIQHSPLLSGWLTKWHSRFSLVHGACSDLCEMNSKVANAIDSVADSLVLKGVKLVCVDFDNTLVDLHTFGQWPYDAQALQAHFQPALVLLLSSLMNKGVRVAVTTFSSQEELIARTLELVFHSHAAGMLVRASGGTWSRSAVAYEGKTPHMESATAHFGVANKQHVLLLDDDNNNVLQAQQQGFGAVLVTKNLDTVFAHLQR